MKSAPTLEKIKKLLRLAKDKAASPAEAANAMRRALEMAEKAGLQIGAIDPDDDTQAACLKHDTAPMTAFGTAESLAIGLVRRQFKVQPFLSQDDNGKQVVHFIGSPDGCQLARYAFVYLVRVMRAAWKENTDRRLKRQPYLEGFAYAISLLMPDTFRSLPSESLILSAESYVKNELLPAGSQITTRSAPKTKSSGAASRRRGFQDGNKQGINNALKGGATNLELS